VLVRVNTDHGLGVFFLHGCVASLHSQHQYTLHKVHFDVLLDSVNHELSVA
jgi:hypothetical protein